MKKRTTVTIDKELLLWARKKQAQLLLKSTDQVSFSKVINTIIREAMMAEVNYNAMIKVRGAEIRNTS